MKKLLIALLVSLGVAGAAVADDKKAPSAQQEKMAKCNKDAGEKKLKGDERKAFMSECLKAKADAAKPEVNEQQSKMGACNKEATQKSLKGEDRKKFMSGCLKGEAKADDATAKCEASAAEKKLAGAAKSSHVKKCVEDAKGGKKEEKKEEKKDKK